jgi:sulfur carrier protein ThiS
MSVTLKHVKDTFTLDLPEGATVLDAMAAQGIDDADVGFAVIKGKAVRKDHVLADGDDVMLYPAIVGG